MISLSPLGKQGELHSASQLAGNDSVFSTETLTPSPDKFCRFKRSMQHQMLDEPTT